MANPLQPACVKLLENEFSAYTINLMAASKAGHMDIIACIKGEFWGFEIKWKNDSPSLLQKEKINKCIAAGGKAFFIRSTSELRGAIINNLSPIIYPIKSFYIL
jgi:hypothetical protein